MFKCSNVSYSFECTKNSSFVSDEINLGLLNCRILGKNFKKVNSRAIGVFRWIILSATKYMPDSFICLRKKAGNNFVADFCDGVIENSYK